MIAKLMSSAAGPPARAGGGPVRSLPLQMLLGLAAGLLVGSLWPSAGRALEPVGTAFVSAVRMVVIPLVFCAVALAMTRLAGNAARFGRVALVSFGGFYASTLVALAVGLALDRLFEPGAGLHLHASAVGSAAGARTAPAGGTAFFLDLIPSNVVAAMAEQKILPTLVFAVLFGLALAKSESRGKPVVDVLETILQSMFRITGWIVSLAPLAVFAIVAWLVATGGSATLLVLAKLVALMYVGFALFAALCIGAFALLGENPLAVTRRMLAPVLVGFFTRSSEVALPLHMERLEEIGIPGETVSVVLPLGYSFNLDGTALYLGLACAFLAEAYGLHLSRSSLVTVLVAGFIAGKGVANVPSSALVAMTAVLAALGVPVQAVAVVAGVDVFMDMGRTAVNVFGNTATVLAVHKLARERAARGGPPGREREQNRTRGKFNQRGSSASPAPWNTIPRRTPNTNNTWFGSHSRLALDSRGATSGLSVR